MSDQYLKELVSGINNMISVSKSLSLSHHIVILDKCCLIAIGGLELNLSS